MGIEGHTIIIEFKDAKLKRKHHDEEIFNIAWGHSHENCSWQFIGNKMACQTCK